MSNTRDFCSFCGWGNRPIAAEHDKGQRSFKVCVDCAKLEGAAKANLLAAIEQFLGKPLLRAHKAPKAVETPIHPLFDPNVPLSEAGRKQDTPESPPLTSDAQWALAVRRAYRAGFILAAILFSGAALALRLILK